MGHYNTAQTTKFTFVLKPQMGVMVLHLLNEPSYWSMVCRLPNVNFNMRKNIYQGTGSYAKDIKIFG